MLALLIAFGSLCASAQEIKTVFVIAMENHNWTQPANQFAGKTQQIYKNPNAPFINSLVSGSASGIVNGSTVRISEQVAYATAYHNVLSTPDGDNPHIHPSEPNYIWAEAGTNFDVANDNDPYASNGPTNQTTLLHLSALLMKARKTWRAYQEDIDLTLEGVEQYSNIPHPEDQWSVPLTSFSGIFASGGFNEYNSSRQYSYAAKHNPMVFFTDTNGGDNAAPTNPLSTHYAPLQQLLIDLHNNTVADYNWITPDQYNDMHSSLTGGYKALTGGAASIRQGDDFLSKIVPIIMASKAYQDRGLIILWWDEAESDGIAGDNADDFTHTIPEIIISPRAHRNVNGVPYASQLNYTHSSDLRTVQEIFRVGPFLGDAANAVDLSDLFESGSFPKTP
jgi:hypothetical protein